MENTMLGGQNPSPAYDFRVYDQVWQRVAPGADPFSADPAAAGMTAPPAVPATAAPAPQQENGGEGNLPGAEPNPATGRRRSCCAGPPQKSGRRQESCAQPTT